MKNKNGFLTFMLGLKMFGALAGGFALYKTVSHVTNLGLYNKKYVTKLIEKNAELKAERKLWETKREIKFEKDYKKKYDQISKALVANTRKRQEERAKYKREIEKCKRKR